MIKLLQEGWYCYEVRNIHVQTRFKDQDHYSIIAAKCCNLNKTYLLHPTRPLVCSLCPTAKQSFPESVSLTHGPSDMHVKETMRVDAGSIILRDSCSAFCTNFELQNLKVLTVTAMSTLKVSTWTVQVGLLLSV